MTGPYNCDIEDFEGLWFYVPEQTMEEYRME